MFNPVVRNCYNIANFYLHITFNRDVFSPLSLPRRFIGLDCTMYKLVARRVSYKKQELLTLREHLSSPPVFGGGPCCLSFLCCLIMCHYVMNSVL
jgi:hypothetical protein